MTAHNVIVLHVNDTPSGRLLAHAITIMNQTGVTMGEAMEHAQADANRRPS